MIRLLVKLGRWLDSRFPAKVIVTESDYAKLHHDISICMEKIEQVIDIQKRLVAVEAGLVDMQKAAVHKDAVKDLVLVVKSVKEDFQSLKTSLGFNARQANPELSAVLNGEYLGGSNE